MSTTWRMRYRFRLAKPLSAQDEVLTFHLGQRPVTLKSRTGSPLRDARYLVCLAEEFESEAEARAFGGRLRHALLRTSVHTRNGVDLGEDRATSVFGSSVKGRVLEEHGAALLDDVHGLMVYPDTPMPHVASLEGTGSVLFSPELFLGTLASAFDQGGVVPEELEVPVELYCASCMEPSPIGQLILAVSAIEAMVGDLPSRPDPELALLEQARQAVEQAGADRETRQRVLSTLGGLGTVGVRRAGREFVERHLRGQGAAFLEVYDYRGRVAHRHGRPDRARAASMAHRAQGLAAELIATLLPG